jgi:GTP diphosphokinase / guanosine-3',5'-bis(diphosphate) 3'-diphosphatase
MASGLPHSNRNPDILFAGLITQVKTVRPGLDVERLRRAYDFSKAAHGYQLRRSGDPYITHCVEVGLILVELLESRVDETLLTAALLHDVVEDTKITLAEVEQRFGVHVSRLVDALTKISGLSMSDRMHEQANTFRKMLLSMAKDIRVVLIKLADRLHNMRTLEHLKRERAVEIASETIDIYAPLAHRLGIATVKWELEDLAFKHSNPDLYRELAKKVEMRRFERERFIEEVKDGLHKKLVQMGIKAEVAGRPKHFYSIAKKMQDQGRPFEEIFDLLGIRIITTSVDDCYKALGAVHSLYTPIHDRFTDYVATPKSNMYQSLHTTVMAPGNQMVEVQIRTREMHRVAELGVAAHYSYKEGGEVDAEAAVAWAAIMRQTAQWSEEATTPDEFLEYLKIGLYQDEVFVFTPRGDLVHLPKGSTPIDFAYHIHTQVGERTVGARVNNRIVPLRHMLVSGDHVEIITSQQGQPSADWLGFVQTSRARSKIRRWIKAQRHEHSTALGREMFEREVRRLRRRPVKDEELADLGQGLGIETVEALFAALANGEVSLRQLIQKAYPEEAEPERPRRSFSLEGLRDLARLPARGVSIQGLDNLMISFAKCCMPVPGDRITGIITRGRGVTVHRVNCPNAFDGKVEPERQIRVDWNTDKEQSFLVKLLVSGVERRGLLADVAKAVSASDTNIRRSDMGSEGGAARGTFYIEVRNLRHLERVMRAVRDVKGVDTVERHQVFGDAHLDDDLPAEEEAS